jgi:transcriptional regulator with XRE-family HTH domain
LSSKKYPRNRDFSEIGKRIRKIRGALSQAAFAVNQNTVSRWEKGRVLSDEDTLKKIAAHGGVTLKWLLRGDPQVLPGPQESITLESPALPSAIHEPFLFGGIDIGAMAQIIDAVEENLIQRKKPLKSKRKALLISLLYDQFQKTGQPLNQATLKEFLRRVD